MVSGLQSMVDSEADTDERKSREDNSDGDSQVLEPAGGLRHLARFLGYVYQDPSIHRHATTEISKRFVARAGLTSCTQNHPMSTSLNPQAVKGLRRLYRSGITNFSNQHILHRASCRY